MSLRDYLEAESNENKPLSEKLFIRLQEDILAGKLSNGEKLTEIKISKMYNVSRTPVRDCLRQLEDCGLIISTPNKSSIVTSLSPSDISDLFELQCQEEILAVTLAIERITEEELDMISENFGFMEFYTGKNDIPKMLNINSTFHKLIYNATHNKRFIKELQRNQLYLRYCNPSNYYAPHYLQDVLVEHRDIYDAIMAKNKKAGIEAMRYHMNQSRTRKFI